MAKALHHRLKTFLDFRLSGGGHAGEGAAVKRILRRQDFKTSFIVAVFARQFEQAFIGFAAAVAKKYFAGANQSGQFFRQRALRFLEIKIGNMRSEEHTSELQSL